MIEIEDLLAFNQLKSYNKPIILFFYAQWQEESLTNDMQELLMAMKQKYDNVTFCMLEAEKVIELSEFYQVSVVPTFVAIIGESLVGKVEGANPSDLSKLVKLLNSTPIQTLSPQPSFVESVIKGIVNTG